MTRSGNTLESRQTNIYCVSTFDIILFCKSHEEIVQLWNPSRSFNLNRNLKADLPQKHSVSECSLDGCSSIRDA